MEAPAPTPPIAPGQEDDLEFNYVADELCVVVSRDPPTDPSAPQDDAVPSDAIYDAVLEEINRKTDLQLEAAESAPPDLLFRLRAAPRLLAPLARPSPRDVVQTSGPPRTVVLPRRDDARQVLCFYSLPHDASDAAPADAPADGRWTGPELAACVGLLVTGINHNRRLSRYGPLSVPQDGWRIHRATPNWLFSTQGDHTGGGPGSLPKPVTEADVQQPLGPAREAAAAGGRRWRFHFDDTALEQKVTDQRAEADVAAAAPPSGDASGAGASGRVIVAVLDTCPQQEVVDRAASDHADNWLLQDVRKHVRLDGEIVPGAGSSSLFEHLRYYVPNWGGGLRLWRDIYAQAKGDRDELARLRREHFAMPDHGLFAAGIIRDIVPTAEVHLIRVLDDMGIGDLATLTSTLSALPERLLSGANRDKRLVVNLSLMADVPQKERLEQQKAAVAAGDLPPPRRRWLLDAIESYEELIEGLFEAVAALAAQGVLIVAAAGNDALGPVAIPAPRPPASFGQRLRSVVSVASINSDGQPSDFSNRGNDAETGTGVATFGGEAHREAQGDGVPVIPQAPVAAGRMNAPVGVFSSDQLPLNGGPNETGWVWWAGTSFSAPVISALAATFWSENPDLTPHQVVALIGGRAGDVETPLHCNSIACAQH